MNHLVVIAHPRDDSFNKRVASVYVEELQKCGHEVAIRDLYKMNWNPVAAASDLSCMSTGRIPDDIKREQDYIIAADVITFIHPIWWIGLPAIIKGYVDRVFLVGFAYRYGPNGTEGMLMGKRAMLFTSSGSTQDHFDQSGKMKSILVAQDLGTIEFCGMEVVEHVHFAPVGRRSTPEMIERWMQGVRDRVHRHFPR